MPKRVDCFERLESVKVWSGVAFGRMSSLNALRTVRISSPLRHYWHYTYDICGTVCLLWHCGLFWSNASSMTFVWCPTWRPTARNLLLSSEANAWELDSDNCLTIALAMESEPTLTGCYLLIVLSEPLCEDHKEKIIQRIAKGLAYFSTVRHSIQISVLFCTDWCHPCNAANITWLPIPVDTRALNAVLSALQSCIAVMHCSFTQRWLALSADQRSGPLGWAPKWFDCYSWPP